MTKTSPAPGVYVTASGFRAVACIGRGKGRRMEKAFPAGTPVRTMTRWQEDARRELRDRPVTPHGSLAEDVGAYIAARKAMPTATERARHLHLWAATLGATRHRDTVTSIEIRGVLDRWLRDGLNPATCNRRRTALQSFFTVLNGKSGRNPVKDVPRLQEADAPPRRIDYPTFEALLHAMPDYGSLRQGVSQTKARLRVLAYTGLPHAQIEQLRPDHLVAAERILLVKGRKKGHGTGTVWLPLSRRGLEAVEALFAGGAIGPFSQGSMYRSVKRAAGKIGRPDLRPYDLRHLFGQTVLRCSRNRAATRDLMLHTSDATTARYVAAAISYELRAALDAFDAEVVGTGCGNTSEHPHATPASRASA